VPSNIFLFAEDASDAGYQGAVLMKFAISGFGRIGKMVMRAAVERKLLGKKFELVAINTTIEPKADMFLFTHDTVHGKLGCKMGYKAPKAGAAPEKDYGTMSFDGYGVQLVSSRDPAKLDWAALGVDCVLECTGAFTTRDGAGLHLKAGAKKVLISAPCKKNEADATIVMGVNEKSYDRKRHNIVSMASCTTGSLAPVVKVVNDNFGIVEGFMTTCHAYTNDQRILDGNHKDARRARAAALNIIPTSTGAAKAIGEVIPELNGKLDGIALRVPVPCGSITDLTVRLEKKADAAGVNAALKKAAEGQLWGIMDYSTEPLVSSDIVHNPASATIDGLSTRVVGSMAKIFSWYDNEWGYSNRMVDLATKVL